MNKTIVRSCLTKNLSDQFWSKIIIEIPAQLQVSTYILNLWIEIDHNFPCGQFKTVWLYLSISKGAGKGNNCI